MKIYHTETQADYDALMVELEEQGFMWSFGRKLSESNNWYVSEHLTCIRVYDSEVDYASLNYYKEEYSQTPITKYKAKVNKMKFTKENVEKVIDEYFWQADLEPCGDLIAEIHNLDDTPEKVVVPKCFDEWFKEIYERGPIKNARKQFALWKICQFGFGSYLQNVNGEDIKDCELSTWVGNNRMIAIDAVLNGYEVEEEPLYCVKINGQYLVKMIPERNVHKFVEEVKLCIWDTQAYQLTEAEIKKIDERYIPFMVPVGDEHENNE